MPRVLRFISYVYIYAGNDKGNNKGFIKVETTGPACKIEIHLKDISADLKENPVYLFVQKDRFIQKYEIGKGIVENGQLNVLYRGKKDNIEESGISVQQMDGIYIPLEAEKEGHRYCLSMWKEQETEERLFLGEERSKNKKELGEKNEPNHKNELDHKNEPNQRSEADLKSEAELKNKADLKSEPKLKNGADQEEDQTQEKEQDQKKKQNQELQNQKMQEPERQVQKIQELFQKQQKEELQECGIDSTNHIMESGNPAVNIVRKQQIENIQRLSGTPYFGRRRNSGIQNSQDRNSLNQNSKEEPNPDLTATEAALQPQIHFYQKLKLRLPIYFPFEGQNIECLKMELPDIRELPRSCWYFTNNSFLLHGFFNYHYFVLGLDETEEKEQYFIGVPGIFSHQERVMASLFGFPDFQAVKKTDDLNGQFGFWYRIIE